MHFRLLPSADGPNYAGNSFSLAKFCLSRSVSSLILRRFGTPSWIFTMFDTEFLAMLRCPEDHSKLSLADTTLVARSTTLLRPDG